MTLLQRLFHPRLVGAVLAAAYAALPFPAAAAAASLVRAEVHPPDSVGDRWRFAVETPDADISHGAELAVQAFYKGAMRKAGIVVPTVAGQAAYPSWVHPYDN